LLLNSKRNLRSKGIIAMASATFGEQVFVSTDGYSIDCVAHSNNILVCGQSRKDVSCAL
jgi:hypothetical protein